MENQSLVWILLCTLLFHIYQINVLQSFHILLDDIKLFTKRYNGQQQATSEGLVSAARRELHEFIPLDLSQAIRRNHSCVRSNMTYVFPNAPAFIIIGTQKGGTSALAALLDKHPWLESSWYFEPHYFDQDEVMLYYEDRLDEPEAVCRILRSYLQTNFNLKRIWKYPNLLTFEKTPAYILTENAPRRIKSVVPWAKIIVSLRNPVDRLISQHKMEVSRELENRTISESLAHDINVLRHEGYYVPSEDPFNSTLLDPPSSDMLWDYKTQGMLYRGCYARQLIPWLEYYKHGEDLLVVRYEELRNDPSKVLDEVLSFVGAPSFDYHTDHLKKSYSPVDVSSTEQYDPDLSIEALDYLKRFYKPYNDELADLLGEHWRRVWD